MTAACGGALGASERRLEHAGELIDGLRSAQHRWSTDTPAPLCKQLSTHDLRLIARERAAAAAGN